MRSRIPNRGVEGVCMGRGGGILPAGQIYRADKRHGALTLLAGGSIRSIRPLTTQPVLFWP